MLTDEDTARRTSGLSNVRISEQTVRRRLRESGFRARRPVLGPILKQRHMIARLAWGRACRHWRLHTCQHILLVMNPDVHLLLAMNVIVCTAGVGNILRMCVRGGSVMVWAGICHDGRIQLKIS